MKHLGLTDFFSGTRTQPKDEGEFPRPQNPEKNWFEIGRALNQGGSSAADGAWFAYVGASNELVAQQVDQSKRFSLQTSHTLRNQPIRFFINEQSLWILGSGAIGNVDPKALPPAWKTPGELKFTGLVRYNLGDPDPNQTRVEWVFQGEAHQVHKDGQYLSFLLHDTYANPDIRLIKAFVDPEKVDLAQAEAKAVAHNISQINQIDESRVIPQQMVFNAGGKSAHQFGPMIRCDQQLRNGEDFSTGNHYFTGQRETRVLVTLDTKGSPKATASLTSNPSIASVHDGVMSFGQNDAHAFRLHHITDGEEIRTLEGKTGSYGWQELSGRQPPYLLVSDGYGRTKLDLWSVVESQGQLVGGSFGQTTHQESIRRSVRTPDQLLFLPTLKSKHQLDVVWTDKQGGLSPGASLPLSRTADRRYLYGISRRLFSVRREIRNKDVIGVVQLYQSSPQNEWKDFELSTTPRDRFFEWAPQNSFFDEGTGRIFIGYMVSPEVWEPGSKVKHGLWSAVVQNDGILSDPKWIELLDEAPIEIALPEPADEMQIGPPIRFIGTLGPAITIATNLHVFRFDRNTLQRFP